MRQSAQAVEELAKQANVLKNLVEELREEGSDASKAKALTA